MRHHVVARDPEAEGFVAPARRRVAERSSGRLPHRGGPARDRAGRPHVAAARVALAYASAFAGVQALLDPMPIRAPAK